jgi:hypothetical protein
MVRRGEVFICPVDAVPVDGSMVDPAHSRFWVSWQAEDKNEETYDLLEHAEIDGADPAIAWGRQRASVVWIRLGHRGDTYFSAGEHHADDDTDNEPVPHWPPAGPPAGGWWTPPEPPPPPTRADGLAVIAELANGTRSEESAAAWAYDRIIPAVDADADEETRELLFELMSGWEIHNGEVQPSSGRLGVSEPEQRLPPRRGV